MKNIILLFLIINFFIYNVEAISYTCCKNFETENATLLEGFENSSEWVTASGNPTWGNDNIHVINGTNSMWVKNDPTTDSGYVKKNLSIPMSMNAMRNNGFWVYSSNWTAISNITITFYANPSTKFASKVFTNETFLYGWNRLTFSPSVFTFNGGMTKDDLVVTTRIKLTRRLSGDVANASFDNLEYGLSGRAKAIITFDDGYKGVYDNAYPILTGNGQKAIIFQPKTYVNQTGFVNASNLNTLYNNGWDISGHTWNHIHLTDYSNYSSLYILDNITKEKEWLESLGFIKSSQFMAYPYGEYRINQTDLKVINESKKINIFSMTTTDGQYQSQLHGDRKISEINQQVFRYGATSDTSLTITKINRTIERNGTIVLYFHNVSSEPTSGLNMNVNDFEIVVDYIASRDDIDVITFSDYLIINNTQSNTNYLDDLNVVWNIFENIIQNISVIIGLIILVSVISIISILTIFLKGVLK